MGFRFRKSFPIGKAFRINLSRRGIGASMSIPGTGISWGVSPGRKKASKSVPAQGCLSKVAMGLLLTILGILCLVLLMSFVGGKGEHRELSPSPVDYPQKYPSPTATPGPVAPVPVSVPASEPVRPKPVPVMVELLGVLPKKERQGAEPFAPEPSDDPRAKSLLSMGKNHEKDRRIKPAVRCYSEVANGYPGTTEANEALGRIAALGQKLIPDVLPSDISTPRADPSNRHKRLPDFSGVNEAIDSMGSAAVSGGGSSLCGAPTKAGGSCRNPVSGGGRCYLHR